MSDKELAIRDGGMEMQGMSTQAVIAQVKQIQEIMLAVMKDGEHYGKIPGTDKPTLLKPGAEKLNFTFRLAPDRAYTWRELGNGHRECQVVTRLRHIPSGNMVGEGIGVCSTMESKYRYRNVADYEVTDDPIPQDAKERKQEYRKQGFGMKKVDGMWVWVKYGDSARQENPDIADTYNTVAKMATKRADVAATLTATAASDIFTQDMEDLTDTQPPATPVVETAREDVIKEIAAIVKGSNMEELAKDALRKEIARTTTVASLQKLRDHLKATL